MFGDQFFLVIDCIIVTEVDTEAVPITLLSSNFIFNIRYPKDDNNLFSFLEVMVEFLFFHSQLRDKSFFIQLIIFSDFVYITFGVYNTLYIFQHMIPYKRRSSLKQYVPLKPINQGIKIWLHADAVNGYISECQVYKYRPPDLSSSCVCGGFPTLRHNGLHDLSATLLKEVWSNVCQE